jgi:hypothetical protein
MSLGAQDLIGRSVGPYTIDRLIGEGGFAWVFQAHRESDSTAVALKVLKFRYAGDAEFEARFRNEFTLFASWMWVTGINSPSLPCRSTRTRSRR